MPIDKLELAQIPNIPNARYWGDEPPANLEALGLEVTKQRTSIIENVIITR